MLTSVLMLAAGSLGAAAGAAGASSAGELRLSPRELRVAVGRKATPVERRAVQLFAAEVQRRTGQAPAKAGARYTLAVGTLQSSRALQAYAKGHPGVAQLGRDGYHLAAAPGSGRTLFVIGQSPSGVVAGIGKLLRLMAYGGARLTIPAATLTGTPKLPVRGIYFATHFENFYHVAPLAEVDRVIEEFALWGGNSLSVWFDMHHFAGFDDPAARRHLARLKHFGETARGVGMEFGLTFLANEGYNTSPEAVRAKWLAGWPHYHVETCPSKPEGLALTGKWQAEVIGAFPAVDFIWSWPYDQGGCACEECAPWGANGFLRASEQLARLFHQRFPKGKVWLSTWLFDSLGAKGEYDGLLQRFRERPPEWVHGILTGTHGDHIPHQLLERPQPERYPLTGFPEISMYQMDPWGGCGANPLPGFCTRLAADVRGRTQGGWPYSEGIYEDLNKFIWSQLYWDPDRATDDILREYASYYLGPESADEAVHLFRLLEDTHPRTQWRVTNLNQADLAWAAAERIDARLPAWAKESWRWRLLYVRARIDHILKHQGYRSPEAQAALQPLCDEIVRLYHAEKSFIRPPAFPKPPNPDNLAYGCPATVSSTHPDCAGTEPYLTDGVLAQENGENFWASDPAKGETAWVMLDLGKPREIREVRLQFRGLYGKFFFIPSRIRFEVSGDGERFETALETDKVPKEGSVYSPEFWVYPLGKQGRYLRLVLGPSQYHDEPYRGVLELTEIEVMGKLGLALPIVDCRPAGAQAAPLSPRTRGEPSPGHVRRSRARWLTGAA